MKCRYFKSTNKKCRGGGKTIMDTKEIKTRFKNVFKMDIKDNSVLVKLISSGRGWVS